jgi:hypothetical protein
MAEVYRDDRRRLPRAAECHLLRLLLNVKRRSTVVDLGTRLSSFA